MVIPSPPQELIELVKATPDYERLDFAESAAGRLVRIQPYWENGERILREHNVSQDALSGWMNQL